MSAYLPNATNHSHYIHFDEGNFVDDQMPTGEVEHKIITDEMMCQHCGAEPAIMPDWRMIGDQISKYWLGRNCLALTDEEFFGTETQTPIGE
jgi:hypothetical protein